MCVTIKRFAFSMLLLVSTNSIADTAYVTDTVTVAIFPTAELKGEPVERLLSGTLVSVMQSSKGVAQVKTSAGNTGWLRTDFLTTNLPAVIKLENAQHELSKANTELNEADEKINEQDQQIAAFKKENAALKKDAASAKDVGWMRAEMEKARNKAAALEKQLELQEAQVSEVDKQTATFEEQIATLQAEKQDLEQRLAATMLINGEADAVVGEDVSPQEDSFSWAVVTLVLGLVAGFVAGYYWLDRRLRQRFGGVRVY